MTEQDFYLTSHSHFTLTYPIFIFNKTRHRHRHYSSATTRAESTLFLLSNLYCDVCGCFSGYFATCIVLILGTRLSTAYKSLWRDFESQLLQDTKIKNGQYLCSDIITTL
jgi:hypothetical protein